MKAIRKDLTRYIKAEASRLGFDACGIAPAEKVDEVSCNALQEWLAQGEQQEWLTWRTIQTNVLIPVY